MSGSGVWKKPPCPEEDNMEQPLISVIIPCHNVAPWLNRCVDCLLDQPGPSREIILVEDSSTDDTSAICEDYARRDLRVRVTHVTFRDVSLTRNAGLDLARGEYVAFSDGDDVVSPELLRSLAPVIEQYRPDLVRYGFRTVSTAGETKDWVLPYPEGLCGSEELREHRLDGISPRKVLDYSIPRVLSASAHLFRREFLNRIQLRFVSQKEILSEDYLFVLRALWEAETVCHLPRVLYDYLEHPGSLSHRPKERMMERKRALIQAYLAFLPGENPEVRRRLRNFYIDSVYDCFVNACTQSSSRKEALALIRPLLKDEALGRCLRKNSADIVSAKTKCICFLMSHRMGLSMYLLYRLMTGRRN